MLAKFAMTARQYNEMSNDSDILGVANPVQIAIGHFIGAILWL